MTSQKTAKTEWNVCFSGIHEVCGADGRNKSPSCEVSDRLLATLEKVQNNTGGNTGARAPRQWINAIKKGSTWMICGIGQPSKTIKGP